MPTSVRGLLDFVNTIQNKFRQINHKSCSKQVKANISPY